MKTIHLLLYVWLCISNVGCNQTFTANSFNHHDADTLPSTPLSVACLKLYNPKIIYNAAYVSIPYPMGDVPASQGVCADVVIRAFRGIGVDLQQLIHEDMLVNFNEYPKLWRLKKPDKSIDHRRVPNLMTFFERKGMAIPITKIAKNYLPGDVVAWQLPNELWHIGMVTHKINQLTQNPFVIHNIGQGQVLSDCLFSWKIKGVYRYNKQP